MYTPNVRGEGSQGLESLVQGPGIHHYKTKPLASSCFQKDLEMIDASVRECKFTLSMCSSMVPV
jgi:hypothetical protein